MDHPLPPSSMPSFSSLLGRAMHRAHSAAWIAARWTLLIWGMINGLGVGLLGRVEQVKRRISRRLPRVSGSFGA
jgi:hypothetical protein